ncbi:blastopia polyprotein, partial [Lasius niger]
MDVIHIDHFGPLQETTDNFKHILVAIDALTRFTWLYPTKSTGAKETIKNLENLVNTFGKPTELVSDRGTAFTAKEFSDFVDLYGIKHRKVAVAAPWANGLAERVNRFLKSSLTKLINSP